MGSAQSSASPQSSLPPSSAASGSKVLVAYATAYGSTKEVAESIAQTLKEQKIDADCYPVEQVTGPLSAYHSVVLGSCVHAGSWISSAITFAQNHKQELLQKNLAFFSTQLGGLGDTDMDKRKREGYMNATFNVIPRSAVKTLGFFGGKIDLSKMSWCERTLFSAFGSASFEDKRDWNAIKAWATSLASSLPHPPADLPSASASASASSSYSAPSAAIAAAVDAGSPSSSSSSAASVASASAGKL